MKIEAKNKSTQLKHSWACAQRTGDHSTDTCSALLTAALLAIARGWKLQYPPEGGLVVTMWCTHTVEYYLDVKEKEVMNFSSI